MDTIKGLRIALIPYKNIKDAGPVYYKRPAYCLTDPVNKPNIEVIIKAMNDIL